MMEDAAADLLRGDVVRVDRGDPGDAGERVGEVRWPRRPTRCAVELVERGVAQLHQPPFACGVGVVEVEPGRLVDLVEYTSRE